MPGYVCIQTANMDSPDGISTVYNRGNFYELPKKFAADRGAFFAAPDDVQGDGTAVEQATAAPGEKRTKSKAKK